MQVSCSAKKDHRLRVCKVIFLVPAMQRLMEITNQVNQKFESLDFLFNRRTAVEQDRFKTLNRSNSALVLRTIATRNERRSALRHVYEMPRTGLGSECTDVVGPR